MLTEIARDIWIADGDRVSFLGFPYPTRMTVVRLLDGNLWVWSPIQLGDQLRQALNERGPVRHLVSPNKVVQRVDPATVRGWRRAIMTLDGVVGVNGSTPGEWRWSFWNRTAARKAKRKILDWNPERVIIAHGEWIRENGRETLERALAWIG